MCCSEAAGLGSRKRLKSILAINNMGTAMHVPLVAEHHYAGLLEAFPDARIFVVRDTPGITNRRVVFATLPRWVRKSSSIVRILARLFQGWRILKREEIGLIHGVHLWPQGVIAAVLASTTRTPCVITIVAGARELELYGRWLRWIGLWAIRRCRVVTVTGKVTMRTISERYPIKDTRIEVLPNVVDIDLFAEGAHSCDRPIDVVSTSRFFQVKNVQTIVEVIAALKKHMPGLRAVLCGTGPLEAEIRLQVERNSLGSTIQFRGWLPPKDLAAVLRESKILLLTSTSEGFPMGVLEAMAAGVPCVASNVGDMEDIVRDGHNGFLVEDACDVSTFVAKASLILGDSERGHVMAGNAIETAKFYGRHAAGMRWKELARLLETSTAE